MKMGKIVNKGSWDAVHRQLLEQARAIGMSLILADNQAKRQALTYARLRRYAGRRSLDHALIKPIKLPVRRADLDLRIRYVRLRSKFDGPIPIEWVLGEEMR